MTEFLVTAIAFVVFAPRLPARQAVTGRLPSRIGISSSPASAARLLHTTYEGQNDKNRLPLTAYLL